MSTNAASLALLTDATPNDVFRIIQRTERLVEDLGLPEADLQCAQEALKIAKLLGARRQYSEACLQAARAGALAISLNDRFDAYVAVWKALQSRIRDLEEIGFPTEELEEAVGLADKQITVEVEDAGGIVPDYVGATAILQAAWEHARTLLESAREASHEIFVATLAVESLSSGAPGGSDQFVVGLESKIEQATRELAKGCLPTSLELSQEVRRQADEALVHDTRLGKMLVEGETLPVEVREEVTFIEPSDEDVESAPSAHEDGAGAVAAAKALPDRLSRDSASYIHRMAQAQGALERAERVRLRLEQEGFTSANIDDALLDARRALGAGDSEGVRRSVDRASQTFVRRRDERTTLAREIEELQQRILRLQDFNLPLLPDVQEVLSRAKEGFEAGRLVDASDFLVCANDLMSRATRTGSG